MARRRQKTTPKKQAGRVGLAHGRVWNAMQWYVPFEGEQAVIYHGHEDPDDHSACGPYVFCCPKAACLFLQLCPEGVPANTEWEFTEGRHLASWIRQKEPDVFYFFFCDPDDLQQLRFSGIETPELRDVLLKRLSLDPYLEKADRLYGMDS